MLPKETSSPLRAHHSLDMCLASSRRAMEIRCTSSGPSAMRRVRAPAHSRASGKSSETPPPPCAWIAVSSTSSTVDGASTFAAAILPRACAPSAALSLWGTDRHGKTQMLVSDCATLYAPW